VLPVCLSVSLYLSLSLSLSVCVCVLNILERSGRVFEVICQQWKSLVEELPVKSTSCTLVLSSVCKILIVYHVNERTHNRLVVLGYWLYNNNNKYFTAFSLSFFLVSVIVISFRFGPFMSGLLSLP